MGTACSRSHLRLHTSTTASSASEGPVGQLCEKVHSDTGPMFLASGPYSVPWGLRKCAWNNPHTHPHLWAMVVLVTSTLPPPSIWLHFPKFTLWAQAISGVGGRTLLGGTSVPSSCAPYPHESPSVECLLWESLGQETAGQAP
jgi:hypothetical protein